MTEIFKIEMKNKVMKGFGELYFETQDAAESVINTFNAMAAKGKKIKWECSKIYVLSKQDAYEEFLSIAETLPK